MEGVELHVVLIIVVLDEVYLLTEDFIIEELLELPI